MLPHGTGRSSRDRVRPGREGEALRGGADEVGGEDLVKRIDDGWFDFDVAIATPDMMGMVGRLGKKLGPRGLMPNPKSGTVTFDIERAVSEIKSGRIEFKVDRAGIVHATVGRASFTPGAAAGQHRHPGGRGESAKPSGAGHLHALADVGADHGARRPDRHSIRAGGCQRLTDFDGRRIGYHRPAQLKTRRRQRCPAQGRANCRPSRPAARRGRCGTDDSSC